MCAQWNALDKQFRQKYVTFEKNNGAWQQFNDEVSSLTLFLTKVENQLSENRNDDIEKVFIVFWYILTRVKIGMGTSECLLNFVKINELANVHYRAWSTGNIFKLCEKITKNKSVQTKSREYNLISVKNINTSKKHLLLLSLQKILDDAKRQ